MTLGEDEDVHDCANTRVGTSEVSATNALSSKQQTRAYRDNNNDINELVLIVAVLLLVDGRHGHGELFAHLFTDWVVHGD